MSRIANIFTRVRDKLGDSKGQRWENDTLIRLLQDALDDVSLNTKMFRGVAHIPLIQGYAEYSLPDNLIDIKQVLSSGIPVDLRSSYYMDDVVGKNWRNHTGNFVDNCVYDPLDVLTLRVYPIPITPQVAEAYSFDPNTFGVATSVDDFNNIDDYGIIDSIIDSTSVTEYSNRYGLVTDILDSRSVAVIYTRKATHPETLEDELEIPPVYDKALVYYITGMALRNDIDAQNRSAGNEEIMFYERELGIAAANSSKNQVSNNKHNTVYRGMG